MAITPTGTNAALASQTNAHQNPKGVLGKDDFMKLLLVQLQYQDPTAPMDTEKILTQTSQLATLESSDNTNKALEDLAKSLGSAQQFSTIAAIGKTADLGSDAISLSKDEPSTFELYFPSDVSSGTISVKDGNGNIVQTIDVGKNAKGVYRFTWDGKTSDGTQAQAGIYHISADYNDANGEKKQTRLGAYPIESVRFDGDQTLLKLGSRYIPLSMIKEVY